MICMGDALHCLFAMIMRHCEPSVPDTLWEEFKHHLCDDIRHRLRTLNILHPSNADMYDYGLFLLNKHLCDLSGSLSDFVNMPHILYIATGTTSTKTIFFRSNWHMTAQMNSTWQTTFTRSLTTINYLHFSLFLNL
jgi:hypothetical protein